MVVRLKKDCGCVKMTYKELAAKLNVSPATISLVINNKPGISHKTRSYVQKALQELGIEITEEKSASVETSDASKADLGFILYKNNGELLGYNSFFPLILPGIEDIAYKNGYNIVVISIDMNDAPYQIRRIKDSNCIGCVIFATEMQREDLALFESLNLPLVIFDNQFVDTDYNTVKVNNQQGTYIAAEHLYKMGHRKIGYLSSGLNINSFHERRASANNALKSFGITNMDDYTYTIGYPYDQVYENMKALLKKGVPLPTAFMADNDLVAVGAMKAIKEAGYRVPEDISFIGFDDRPICTFVEPNLSTISLPRYEFGAIAVEQLIRQLDNDRLSPHPRSPVTIGIEGNLISRQSVAKINA